MTWRLVRLTCGFGYSLSTKPIKVLEIFSLGPGLVLYYVRLNFENFSKGPKPPIAQRLLMTILFFLVRVEADLVGHF